MPNTYCNQKVKSIKSWWYDTDKNIKWQKCGNNWHSIFYHGKQNFLKCTSTCMHYDSGQSRRCADKGSQQITPLMRSNKYLLLAPSSAREVLDRHNHDFYLYFSEWITFSEPDTWQCLLDCEVNRFNPNGEKSVLPWDHIVRGVENKKVVSKWN